MSGLDDLQAANAELASLVRERLNGRISYLATAARNGALRVHPIVAIVAERAIYVFMEANSPKGHDLLRGGRYALHRAVEDTSGGLGEVMVGGFGRSVTNPEERARAVAAATYAPRDRYVLFELNIDEALATHYSDDIPVRRGWRAPTWPRSGG